MLASFGANERIHAYLCNYMYRIAKQFAISHAPKSLYVIYINTFK